MKNKTVSGQTLQFDFHGISLAGGIAHFHIGGKGVFAKTGAIRVTLRPR